MNEIRNEILPNFFVTDVAPPWNTENVQTTPSAKSPGMAQRFSWSPGDLNARLPQFYSQSIS